MNCFFFFSLCTIETSWIGSIVSRIFQLFLGPESGTDVYDILSYITLYSLVIILSLCCLFVFIPYIYCFVFFV